MVPRFASAHRQRGAIGLMAAITLGIALLFILLVIDTGRLYMEKRALQRVVDTAALEASNLNAVCSGTGVNALTQAKASAARNGYIVGSGNTLTATCGTLTTGSNNLRTFTASTTATQAIQVTAAQTVTTSFTNGLWTLLAGGSFSTNTTLHATATAGYVGDPLAQLTIRSGLVSISSSQSALLNALIGGVLGGSLNLTAVQYQGLANTNLNLLSYLNQAALSAGVTVGDYTTLLNTNVSVATLVQAAATVVQQSGSAVSVTSTLGQISALGSGSTIKLGSLIQAATGTSTAGLDANVQLLQLVQGLVQVAGKGKALDISAGVNLGALANVSVKLGLIQPPQFSATGNPDRAKLNPTGADRIYVSTAQTRLLISFQSGLVNSAVSLATGAINFLSDTLCIVGTCTAMPDATASVSIDVGVLAATGSAYVIKPDCTGTNKALTVQSDQSAATIILGSIDSTSFFSSASPPVDSPLTLVDIGTKTCTRSLLGALVCGARTPSTIATVKLGGNFKVAPGTNTSVYTPAPNVGQAPLYKTFSSNNIVTNLGSSLSNSTLVSVSSNSGGLFALVGTIVSTLLGSVGSALSAILGPLLDPIINNLLSLLGLDLATLDVGANLTCHTGRSQLVL